MAFKMTAVYDGSKSLCALFGKMEKFKIYINDLKQGQIKTLEEKVSPDFLEIHEEGLCFCQPIAVQGQVYLADDHLIAHLKIDAAALLPCRICNENARLPLVIEDLYLSVAIAEIKNSVFNLSEEIRQAIFLQVPQFAECNGGCPNREFIQGFLEKTVENRNLSSDTVHFPFSDL